MEGKLKIADLILEGEHTQQDFKYAISDSRKISKSLSAFANTIGGRLLVGIKDNGNVAGVRTDEEYYMIESAAHLYCHPRVEFDTYNWEVNEKTVLQVNVDESKNKPHFVKNKDGSLEAFIRINDENIKAPEEIILLWSKQKQELGSLIRYSYDEEKLFEYLKSHDSINRKEFQLIAKIKAKEAANTLANLIRFELIYYYYTGSEFRYSLIN